MRQLIGQIIVTLIAIFIFASGSYTLKTLGMFEEVKPYILSLLVLYIALIIWGHIKHIRQGVADTESDR